MKRKEFLKGLGAVPERSIFKLQNKKMFHGLKEVTSRDIGKCKLGSIFSTVDATCPWCGGKHALVSMCVKSAPDDPKDKIMSVVLYCPTYKNGCGKCVGWGERGR